jgi:drug/metabolite transporter (DMT)-like permease
LGQGIVGSGIGFTVMSWCIQARGPLYVSMFSPLLLVIVAIIGWAILGEKIRVGTYVRTHGDQLQRPEIKFN